ncbi:MAG TPA: family 1 glycosylhydrolase, partial [Acidimicrobiales bacterium]|nr:family 1 glycosylhydrolase [Acidimicrobiales bacterium]
AFRLSVEWARVEPHRDHVDETALDRYAGILDACAERGLEPVVTLHHFTHPWWLGEEFWLTPGSPDRFAAHVERVVTRLAGRCRRWVTINEPNVYALMGWIEGACPPGRRLAASDAVEVIDNLLTGHVLAYEVIHRVQPEATVLLNTGSSSIYEHDRLLTDLLWARHAGIARDDLDAWIDERRVLHDLALPPVHPGELALRRVFAAFSPYGTPGPPGGPLARAGRRLRRHSARRLVDVLYAGPHERPLDAVGFDWYDPIASHALRRPGHRSAGGRSWAPSRAVWDVVADPEGLTNWCVDQHRLFPGAPVWVVENGMATLTRHGRAVARTDGGHRPRYLCAHLRAMVRAAEAGVPIAGYLHWSLMDNYEWGSYEPRFGIYGIERTGSRVRWLDTDSDGCDSAGAFAGLVRALADGDRRVLETC